MLVAPGAAGALVVEREHCQIRRSKKSAAVTRPAVQRLALDWAPSVSGVRR